MLEAAHEPHRASHVSAPGVTASSSVPSRSGRVPWRRPHLAAKNPNPVEPIEPQPWRALALSPLRLLSRRLLVCGFLVLILFADLIAGWPIVQPSVAFAQALKNANPPLAAPAWLNASNQTTGKQPNLGQYVASVPPAAPTAPQPPAHQWSVSMGPARLALTEKAQKFVGSDGHLEVDIPAHSLDAAQLATIKGGLQLYMTQVKPGGGSTNNGGLISFGTYEFQFFDGAGKPVNGVNLLHPFTLHLRLRKEQQPLVWSGQKVYTLWNAVQGAATPPAIASPRTNQAKTASAAPMGVMPQAVSNQPARLAYAQGSQQGMDWSVQSSFAAPASSTSTNARSQAAVGTPAVQASTVAFNTQAPQATWGTPSDFQVGLNSGGLNYNYPLSIPPGPGGLTPPVTLNYSSGSVSENHGWQSAAPWVGGGWSLDLGSISWAQENVTPNGSPEIENVWHISDPSGIGGQLVPPDRTYSTTGTLNPSLSNLQNSSNIYLWQSAPFSHAKIREVAANGYPCWQVYLPSGTREDFGCTNDSRESYKDSSGHTDVYSWKLDLMIDRFGNQVQISYQQLSVNGSIRDAVLKDIKYDDPTCHNTASACSTWNPKIDLHFDASQSIAHLLGGGCSGTPSNARCDDPRDLSGSGGLPAPQVMSAYVLNDLKVEVQGNLLREYSFYYTQGSPQTITDPNTGKSESVVGYLNLNQIHQEGTNDATFNAPVTTIAYAGETEHYSDTFSYAANNGTVCSPYANAPRDGSSSGPCYLWAQTYNSWYLTNLDNGEGWNESISWKEAHSNTWGVDGGAVNDALNCSSSQTSTNSCGRADDKNWSRVVVASRTATSNGVSATWNYRYYLQTGVGISYPGFSVRLCPGSSHSWGQSCTTQTYDWGDQNDDDAADYYNGAFQSFRQVQVTLPDGSSQTNTYGATTGWGLANSSIVSGNCSLKQINANAICYVAAYSQNNGSVLAPALAGKQTEEQDYDSQGHLLKAQTWNVGQNLNCPPQGVSGSANALGGSSDPGGSQLFSELDHSNPVVVCDPRSTQQDTYLTDGVTSNLSDPRVIHTTTTTTYDGNTCGSQGHDYGNVSKTDESANDVGGAQIVSTSLFCPNDNIGGGIYLTDLAAQSGVQDGSGTQYGCAQNYYGGNASVLSVPTLPEVTRTDASTAYIGGCTGSVVSILHSYDASGNSLTGTDPDGHQGCTSGSAQDTACATYDSFDTHLLTATNAKNQVTTYEYDADAAEAGFGQWLMSETDPNGQTTSYQYDALGRLVAVIRPGDSLSSPTITYTYNNTCSAGKTTPCLEIETTTRFTVGGPTTTKKDWYDGWGHLVETQVPGPNLFSRVPAIHSVLVSYTVYDQMGQASTKSLNYAVAATAGLGYVAPDLNKPRTVTGYDSLGRTLGTVTYGNGSSIVEESTLSYTIAQGVPTLSSESSNAYEQKITRDAYNHQSITYSDGFGRTRYSQVFSGTSSPYSVIRTVGTTYDTVGNTLSVITYESNGTAQATYRAAYDGLKRLVGFNDSDLGSCANTPMPADCSSTTDLAWKYTYDLDGNQLSQTDPRNITTYTSYDALDRPLCSALSAADASSCSGSTNAVSFYDGYSNASTPGAAFPTGCVAPSGSYASDPIGHETAERFVGAGGAGSGWRCSGYDARGHTDQSTLSVTTPDGHTVTQTVNKTYDDQNDVTSLVYPDGEVLTFNYDGNGRFQSAYFGTRSTPDPVSFLVGKTSYTDNGLLSSIGLGGTGPKNSTPTAIFTLTQGYDSIQRAVSTSATEGSSTLFRQTRTYDNEGNVLGLATSTRSASGSTVTENEAFCYDALSRLVWAGNSGTPSGGDHCMSAPSSNGITTYSQGDSYDSLDRLTNGAPGTYTYGDANHPHAATSVSDVPNQYAAYDAMGNMICRNTDTASGHTCAGSTPNAASMTYDNEGRLSSWTAASGTSANETYLYDNEGNEVLVTISQNGHSVGTLYFNNYTETTIEDGTTSTTTYYSVNGQRLAVRVNGSTINYLVSDLLGNVSLALNDVGTTIAVQLYEPYGHMSYSWGTMPTAHNYTGQRLDSQSGLLYYNFRWYDPFIGQFTRTDTIQGNFTGTNPYAYVSDSPEEMVDPTGHWGMSLPWGWTLFGDGAAVTFPEIVVPVILVVGLLWVSSDVINNFVHPTQLACGCIDPSSMTTGDAGWAASASGAAVAAVSTAIAAAAASAAAAAIIGGIAASIDWSGPDQPPAVNGGSARVGAELQALDGEGNVVAQASSRSQPPDPNDPNNRTCAEHWLCKSIDWQKLKDSGVLKVLLKIVSNKGIGPCPQCWAMLTQIAQQYGISISALLYLSTRNVPSSVLIDVIENFEQDLFP